MDDYPEHLAPEFEESGAVKTPFDEWWTRVQPEFPNVPENVAKQWLHRHWGHSPYSWLRSKDYRFSLVIWDSDRLSEVGSGWGNWSNDACFDHGECLVKSRDFWLRNHMVKHGAYPEPIIILDNGDGHIQRGQDNVPEYINFPVGYVLIEGHLRFNMSLYLVRIQRFCPKTEIWLMEHM